MFCRKSSPQILAAEVTGVQSVCLYGGVPAAGTAEGACSMPSQRRPASGRSRARTRGRRQPQPARPSGSPADGDGGGEWGARRWASSSCVRPPTRTEGGRRLGRPRGGGDRARRVALRSPKHWERNAGAAPVAASQRPCSLVR